MRNLWDVEDIQFFSVSLVDGTVLAELPDLQLNSVEYRFEETTSTTAQLPWRNIPSNWQEATTPYSAAVLVCYQNQPLWGGIIVKRERELAGASVELTLATVEHYFDSVYITAHTFSQVDQCVIASTLVSDTLKDHDFQLLVKAETSTIRRDRTYESDTDKTLLSVLQNLANVLNGVEWCTYWMLKDDGGYTPVFWCADHIGSTVPVTTFDESVMTDFTILEDYTSGYGANAVMATSTADGTDVRPQSAWQTSKQANRPIVEYVYSPSSNIKNVDTLNSHAKDKLARLQNGTTTVSFTVSLLAAPVLYVEWQPGDVIGWMIMDDVQQFPDLASGTARVIGYKMSFGSTFTITPTIQADIDEEEEA